MQFKVGLLLILSIVLVIAASPVDARRSTASILHMLDTDNDATVDLAESKKAASTLFSQLDSDKDGTLDAKELEGRMSKADLVAADPDNDGTLTEDEYLSFVAKRFKDADSSQDGKLNIQELSSEPGAKLVKLLVLQIVV